MKRWLGIALLVSSCASTPPPILLPKPAWSPCEEMRRENRLDEALSCTEAALGKDAALEAWDLFWALRQARRDEILAQALLQEQHGDFAKAAGLMESLDLEQASPAQACELGELWSRSGQPAQAQRWFERARRSPLPQPCALRGLGLLALDSGKAKEAEAFSRELIALGEPGLPFPRPIQASAPLADLADQPAITRAEAAYLLVRLGPSRARPQTPIEPVYDIAGHPMFDSIVEALDRGWMPTPKQGLFEPERIVQRIELGRWLRQDLKSPPSRTPDAWRQSFPELGPLWRLPPFRKLQSPRELFLPIRGEEAIELLNAYARLENGIQ